jgi:EXS family
MSSTQEVGEIFGDGVGLAHAMLRSPTVLIAAVGLWGMNLYLFKVFSLDYIKIFQQDLLQIDGYYQDGSEACNCCSGTSTQSASMDENDCDSDQDESAQERPFPSSAALPLATASPVSTAVRRKDRKESRYCPSATRDKAEDRDYRRRNPKALAHRSLSGNSDNRSSSITQQPPRIQRSNSNNSDYFVSDDDCDVTKARHQQAPTSLDDDSDLHSETRGLVRGSNGHHGHYTPAAITWDRLVLLSVGLLLLLHLSYYWWIDIVGGGTIGAVGTFYISVSTAIVLPLPATAWLRKATLITLYRTLELFRPRCCSSNPPPSPTNSATTTDGSSTGSVALPRPIPFVDVFYADAMCSLSKVFFDWGMLFHMLLHYPNPVPAAAHNILIPSFAAAMPYLIRTRQCLIMYRYTSLQHDSHKHQHMANAIKYTTSIFPLCLSAFQKTVSPALAASLEPLLIFLLIVNSVYALYWDVVMDWGMMHDSSAVLARSASAMCLARPHHPGSMDGLMKAASVHTSTTTSLDGSDSYSDNSSTITATAVSSKEGGVFHRGSATSGSSSSSSTSSSPLPLHIQAASSPPASCIHTLLRSRLRFGVGLSVLILAADIILRFGWTLRFYDKLFPSMDAFILFTQFLEVFRRALWNLLRVEWESIKHMKAKIAATCSSSKPLNASSGSGPSSVYSANGGNGFQESHQITNGRDKSPSTVPFLNGFSVENSGTSAAGLDNSGTHVVATKISPPPSPIPFAKQ